MGLLGAACAASDEYSQPTLTPGSLQHVSVLERLSASFAPATASLESIAGGGLSTGGKFLASMQPFAQSTLPLATAENGVDNLAMVPVQNTQTKSVVLYAMGALAVLFALKRRVPRR